ncbi:MAG: hypothetical protein RJA22_1933 [Verrucomicrobiota bacterium]|jgi:hypothetical protein
MKLPLPLPARLPAAVLALVLLAGSGCSRLSQWSGGRQAGGRFPVTITRTNHHGWPDALVMRGGGTEVVVVPAIGRIMQFRLEGEPGPFWENRALDGQRHPGTVTKWINFGGDKTWPAPEAEWPKPGGGWLPPAAFDSVPVEATVEGQQLILTSPVDPAYGIRVVRRLQLGPGTGRLTVHTRYEKISGAPSRVGVWIITQLNDPVLLAAPVPERPPAGFTNAFHLLSGAVPPSLRTAPADNAGQQLLTLHRNPRASHKIGMAGDTLVWVGQRHVLAIRQPVSPSAPYPDLGSSAEIYTNPDPLPYIELEMLSPLKELKPGDTHEWRQIYVLERRQHTEPIEDIRRVLRPGFLPAP